MRLRRPRSRGLARFRGPRSSDCEPGGPCWYRLQLPLLR